LTTLSGTWVHTNSNILNEPISPNEYQLQHRKSIHDYFNLDSGSFNSKQADSSSFNEPKPITTTSPSKSKTTAGMVS